MAHVAAITVLDPSKLPGVPQPLPKGWGAADWDVPDGTDVVAALRGAVTVTSAAPTVELVPIDPTYPTEIVLPPAIIALEPDRGIPLPAGDVGILAGQGGERKSTLTIQMAVAAAAAEDGALVSPFTGLAVDTNDPFIVGGDVGLAVRGGPVCMASWEDAAPWLATRARACAEHLDAQSHSTRHTRVLRDAQRLASVQMSAPLFGVTAVDDRYTVPHTIASGWDPLWSTVRAVNATLITIDPINLAAVWTGYGPHEVGAFMWAIKCELGDTAGALLVGHTGKNAARVDEPSALDIHGSWAWSHRARGCFVARSTNGHYELHLVKANYAPRASWAYKATPTGALAMVNLLAEQRAEHAALDAKVLEHVPPDPFTTSKTPLSELVFGAKGGRQTAKVLEALSRLVAAGQVIVNTKGDRWSTPKAEGD